MKDNKQLKLSIDDFIDDVTKFTNQPENGKV